MGSSWELDIYLLKKQEVLQSQKASITVKYHLWEIDGRRNVLLILFSVVSRHFPSLFHWVERRTKPILGSDPL
jgi:hypothetical protein